MAFMPGPDVQANQVGVAAPACQLTPMGGSPAVDLRQYQGKVLYVDFWASWCIPCAKSFPFMNTLDKEYRERGLQIVGINVDEKSEDAREFLAKFTPSFPVAADASGKCPQAFG